VIGLWRPPSYAKIATLLLGGLIANTSIAAAADEAALALEAKIPLGSVSGRIDHLAVDLARRRLFVAELGNDSLGVVDVAEGKVLQTITGLREPQGVGYVPASDAIYVASARDGSVSLFAGAEYAPAGRIELGDDADNVRVDTAANRVFVGYGGGAIAIIDPMSHSKIGDLRLKDHPEGFQLDPAGSLIFVNVPDARQIAVLDRNAGQQVATWQVPDARANFPMAIDADARRVIVVFRHPARLVALNSENGMIVANVETCGDADDVFVDQKRKRVYVSCGEGFVDIFAAEGASYSRIGHVPTVSGARTSLFVPALDRLYLAIRAAWREPAAIWVFRPIP
jgi:YVTN family beta-propeller protein